MDTAPPRDSAAHADVFRESPPDARPDDGAGQAKSRAAVAKVFDLNLTILHRIDIQILVEHVASVESRTSARLACTFTFDGVTLPNIGIRRAPPRVRRVPPPRT